MTKIKPSPYKGVGEEVLPRFSVDALGIETSYYEAGAGNGRTILLLHGMTSSGDAFRELMVALADEYHLIAPDIPGFGFSETTKPYTLSHLVEWVAALRDALEITTGPLIGHSFGGVVASRFALAYPEDVSALLLLAPALLVIQNVPDFLMKAGVSLGLTDLGVTISQSRVVVPYQIKSSFFNPADQPQSVWERRLRDYENARASADVVKAIARQDPRTDLEQLQQPICMIWGQDDLVVPADNGDVLLEILPQAELCKIAECGHVPVQEQTAVVVERSRAFLHEYG